MRIALTLGAACAAAVLTAGTAATATTTATAATPGAPVTVTTAPATSPAHHHGGVIWGTVVSGPDLKVRDEPNTGGRIVEKLPPGSQDRVECATHGTVVHGNPDWYWLTGARGWVSAAYVDTGGRHVPSCSAPEDPCPQWRDRDCHHDPCVNRDH
ncbi:SH3 domain-containing protein [Streptomyces sp. NPDC005900]|uniref:SH3 domain-containing protein n=1 Tax=unclassified Streptomyces TaxID=2593676 RepID=UPI0033F76B50